ncbi:hypothetical protein [Parahaliea aestuarii]|uniref:DUF3108 domain-containing protein n=1 Tax=Parahaliea aestuarii TaxID=1852021 RepID=A0A5C8ZZ15_9GAMM|nr:hypothetical protein [Parahaliea aestuarii]TXS92637.1 hypothetical protein FVW59_09520 [Parahaliea aestuarii]
MKIRPRIAPWVLLAPALILSGCKIQLSSTEGGSITTQSKRFNCSAGQSCSPVDVSDLTFDETFIARADEGYEFAGWRKRQRGLCGGSKSACAISTAGFAGNNVLMSFLDKPNEVFFMEAVFREVDGDTGSGTGDARRCFNPDLGALDTTIVASYRSTSSGGEVVNESYDQVISTGSYKGRSVLKAVSNTTATGAAPSTSRSEQYFEVKPESHRSLVYGTHVESFTPRSSLSEIELAPHRLQRYDLTAGQSYQQNYTVNVSTKIMGFDNKTSTSVTLQTTFLGIESVTVPAGTYQACRFRTDSTADSVVSTINEWFAVDSGMFLKSTEGTASNVLVSASINGANI